MPAKRKSKDACMSSAVAEAYDIHPQTLCPNERVDLLRPSRTVGHGRLDVDEDFAP